MTEGGWDRTHDCARILGEHNFIVLGLFSTPKRDPSKIERRKGLGIAEAKEGDNANGKYAIGNDSNNKPLAEGGDDNDNEYTNDNDIANNNHEYVVCNDNVGKPLAEGNNEYDTLSAACMGACPESQHSSRPSH